MKLIVKKLQGGECEVDVLPNTTIAQIKRNVSLKLGIPVEDQKLLLLGRTLVDEQTVQSYPTIKEGIKLNLIVKKREGLFEESVKLLKKSGMSESEANNSARRFLNKLEENIYKLSWDDLERLCKNILMGEAGDVPPAQEMDTDDGFHI